MKLRPDGLASFLPALRDASLLVLLHRLLKAGQTAGELMSLSSSLSQQPRKILNCLPKWLFLFPSIRQFGGLQFDFLICIFAYVCKQLFTSIRSVYYWFWPVWTWLPNMTRKLTTGRLTKSSVWLPCSRSASLFFPCTHDYCTSYCIHMSHVSHTMVTWYTVLVDFDFDIGWICEGIAVGSSPLSGGNCGRTPESAELLQAFWRSLDALNWIILNMLCVYLDFVCVSSQFCPLRI